MPIATGSAVDDLRSIIEDAVRVTGNVRRNDAPTLQGDTVVVSAVNGSAQGVGSQVSVSTGSDPIAGGSGL